MADDIRTPLFTVGNHHTPGCGAPPSVDGDTPGRYHGYFENQYGEQAVFVFDPDSGEGTLRLGDAGWGTAYRVVDGQAVDLVLGDEEALWLAACWRAAAGRGR